jgi:alpha-tubulin suppressor-like RCC1 family protein
MECSSTYCFFLSSSQLWYGTGENTFGQLATGNTYSNQTTPLLLTNINQVGIDRIFPSTSEFVFGYNSFTRKIYSWGKNQVFKLLI